MTDFKWPHPQPDDEHDSKWPKPDKDHDRKKKFEIICIEVPKVYDFCFQSERRENVCFDLPPDCVPDPGATVECEVTGGNCTELSRGTPDPSGLVEVTLLITVNLRFIVRNPDGTVACEFEDSFSFTKRVVLCAPDGTEVVCEVRDARCGPCILNHDEICCEIDLCILIQVLAIVKLLVPSYGFCVPEECVVLPKPPLVCPPSNLFPPQCPDENNC